MGTEPSTCGIGHCPGSIVSELNYKAAATPAWCVGKALQTRSQEPSVWTAVMVGGGETRCVSFSLKQRSSKKLQSFRKKKRNQPPGITSTLASMTVKETPVYPTHQHLHLRPRSRSCGGHAGRGRSLHTAHGACDWQCHQIYKWTHLPTNTTPRLYATAHAPQSSAPAFSTRLRWQSTGNLLEAAGVHRPHG